MATIEIDFEVFKALTNLRPTEDTTYNSVLRELLKLPSTPAPAQAVKSEPPKKGWTWKGVTLPHGTLLRAEYKGQEHTAEIVDGRWVQDGKEHGSPSAAAYEITQSGINGWWFWSAKKPGEKGWTSLGKLRPGESGQKAA